MQRFILRITQENLDIAESSDIGCFIISDKLSDEFISKFILKARSLKKLVLTEGINAFSLYKNFGADGYIYDASQSDNPKKNIISMQKNDSKAILGVISRNRRHEAMLISECEPDFIIFRIWNDGLEKNKELLSWYNELFLIQSAVLPEEEVDYKNCSADFVILDDVNLKK